MNIFCYNGLAMRNSRAGFRTGVECIARNDDNMSTGMTLCDSVEGGYSVVEIGTGTFYE